MSLFLGRYDFRGLDVQVSFSVGHGGTRRRTIVASDHYLPMTTDRRKLQTGIIEHFAEVAGNPRLDLSFLLIARRDVRSARNGLWRLAKELTSSIPEPFQRVLTYGRNGRFAVGLLNS
jgi:hypothetical protein